MKTIYIARDKKAGNFIGSFNDYEDAVAAVAEHEADDKEEGTYTEKFYEIIEETFSLTDHDNGIVYEYESNNGRGLFYFTARRITEDGELDNGEARALTWREIRDMFGEDAKDLLTKVRW